MSERKVFKDSVVPLPDQTGITEHGLMVHAATAQHGDESMTLLFSVAIAPDLQAQLEERVAKGEVVPIAELNKTYATKPDDVKALTSWLQTQGFQIIQVTPDGTGIYARATVKQIAQTLGVEMVRVTKDGLSYTAARNAPSMPADVGDCVSAIGGLSPQWKAHKHFRTRVPKAGNRGAMSAGSAAVGGLSPNIENAPPYLVPEILKAYNADGLTVTGKGQTIAILIDTFPADADLTAFWKQNNVRASLDRIAKINVSGNLLPVPEGEETLDAEWTSGIAPDANIRIYASGSLDFVALDLALDRILADLPTQPGLRQLSISLGLGETFLGGPNGEVKTQHRKFLRLAAAGVNVFVSSGDAGSNPDSSGHGATGPTQAEYEASDPSVIGVGGTSLTLAPGGQVSSETAWVSGGGGKSMFFPRPVWQVGPGIPDGNERLVPDVSLTANPDEGALVILNGQPSQIGGTSWSAPVWAGFCALINEARTKAGRPALAFLNPLIYPLIGSASFRDIQSGSNGAFEAGPGYDLITGLGVPNVKELIKALSS